MEKRPPLSKEQIIATAISLADKGGINALSMRKLAGELNVQAMSLYYHFRTKDQLIAYMADELVAEIELETGADGGAEDWRRIMLKRAITAKNVFLKHAWLPFVLDSQLQSGPKRLEYLNNYLGTLRKIGFPIDLAIRVSSLIDSYVYGYCRQLTHVAESDKTAEELAESFSGGFDASQFPYLSEATALAMEHGYDAEADFLFGINIILNGIESERDGVKNTASERDKSGNQAGA